MFWTNILEKYDKFLNLNMRRLSDLNQDRRILSKIWAAEYGEADKAELSIDDITKAEYSSEVQLISDDWEGSCKSAGKARSLKYVLVPLFVPRDHPYYDVYCDVLSILKSRIH